MLSPCAMLIPWKKAKAYALLCAARHWCFGQAHALCMKAY